VTTPVPYAIVDAHPGAVLLDLESGAILQLNQAAALVWHLYLSGETPNVIAESLAKRFGLPLDVASKDASAVLQMPALGATAPSASEFRYERTSTGYAFFRLESRIFEIDQQGSTIALGRDAESNRAQLRQLLRNVAPKILSLRGHAVLHASAVAMGAAVLVLCGDSGAGKTTTARALVRAGARPVAEDKVVLRLETGRVEAVLEAEALIHDWIDRTARDLDTSSKVSCETLDAIVGGPSLPVAELGFIAAAHRRAGPIRADRITALDATGATFQRAFLLSAATEDWIRQLRTSAAIAGAVETYNLEMPDDLGTLAIEARRVTARGTLRQRPAKT
jgi:hypothetical protein